MSDIGAAAIAALKRGLSARAGLAAARAAGLSIRDATWYRVIGELKSALAANVIEAGRPLNRRPLSAEINAMTTKGATGFVQYATVYVKDRATGLVQPRHYAVRGKSLRSRQAVVDKALSAMRTAALTAPQDYDEQVLFGVYGSTYRLEPE